MTTYIPPVSVAARRFGRVKTHRPPRTADGKLAVVSGIETLSACPRADLLALSATADMATVGEGEVLARGRDLARWWWMPVDGWLLLNGEGRQAMTIPSGWSWLPPHRTTGGRLVALRGGRVLTAPVQAILGMMDEHPALAGAIQASLVGQ